MASYLSAGQFNKVHGVARHGWRVSIARWHARSILLDPDGTLSFWAKKMILQPDGKIIFFGSFGGIGRLNSDGSVDSSFTIPRRVSLDGLDDGSGNAMNPGAVESAVLQPDGKLIVVGRFFFVITGPGTNVPRSCVTRFNSDGTFDPSFDPGTGALNTLEPADTVVRHAVRQNVGANSGKIIIQGDFDELTAISTSTVLWCD